jgi:hypothetical protein
VFACLWCLDKILHLEPVASAAKGGIPHYNRQCAAFKKRTQSRIELYRS